MNWQSIWWDVVNLMFAIGRVTSVILVLAAIAIVAVSIVVIVVMLAWSLVTGGHVVWVLG